MTLGTIALDAASFYAECRKQAHHSKCHYAECRGAHLSVPAILHPSVIFVGKAVRCTIRVPMETPSWPQILD
jgi:hypothetical protein